MYLFTLEKKFLQILSMGIEQFLKLGQMSTLMTLALLCPISHLNALELNRKTEPFSMVLSSVSKWLLCFLSSRLCCYCWWNRYLRHSKKNKCCITWLFPLNLSVTTRNVTKWQLICNHQSSYYTVITAHFK